MGMILKNQAERKQARHVFSELGVHYFVVLDPITGKEHEVSIKINCDCRYMGVQGIPNGRVCSDILACVRILLKEISESGSISLNPIDTKQDKINAAKRLIKRNDRAINDIRYSSNEGEKHRKKKEEICAELRAQNLSYITEATFIKNELKADVFSLEQFLIIEIADTEEESSLERKRKEYEKLGLDFKVVRV